MVRKQSLLTKIGETQCPLCAGRNQGWRGIRERSVLRAMVRKHFGRLGAGMPFLQLVIGRGFIDRQAAQVPDPGLDGQSANAPGLRRGRPRGPVYSSKTQPRSTS